MNPTLKNSTIGAQIIELPLANLPEQSLTRVEHDVANLVVIRSAGEVFAYFDKCPHAFWPLSEGSLHNSVLECPGHGWEFDVKTGRCLNAPVYCLTSVPAIVEGDIVRLQIPQL
jgi:nitrite reductase/ring-hydroxylating ferredoxin subunit